MALFDSDDEDDRDWLGLDLRPLLDLSPEAQEQAQRLSDSLRQPLRPGDPRRHHFIPQFFLRRFAANETITRVLVAKPGRHQIMQVKDTAVMKDLYTTIDERVGETVAVERLLAVIDGDAVAPMTRLALGVLFPPQTRDRINLALWLSMLHVRGPDMRRWMEVTTDQGIKAELSLVKDEESARAYLRGRDAEEPPAELVQGLLDSVDDLADLEFVPHQNDFVRSMLQLGLGATPFLLGRRWAVLKFPEPGLLLTDRPLIMYQNPENRSPVSGVGIATADELWVPLDRSTALILHNEELIGERIIYATPDYGIDDFNQALVSQAAREIYCHPDDLSRLGSLDLPAPDRPLMNISGGSWIKAMADGVNAPPKRKGHRRYRRPE